jgi:hypothetical protein
VDLFRYLVALGLVSALCALVWRLTKGRWRWFAAAVTLNATVLMLGLARAKTIDSWGVVAGVPWGFLISTLFAAVLVLPAIALWPRAGKHNARAMISVLLGLMWLLAVQTVFVVGPVWERWQVCLSPGVYYGADNGGPSCEVGPL